MVVLMVV
jgi:hypothetical protein